MFAREVQCMWQELCAALHLFVFVFDFIVCCVKGTRACVCVLVTVQKRFGAVHFCSCFSILVRTNAYFVHFNLCRFRFMLVRINCLAPFLECRRTRELPEDLVIN